MTFYVRGARLADMAELKNVFRRASLSNQSDRRLLWEHPEWLELSDDGVREGRTLVAVTQGGAVAGFATYLTTDGVVELVDLFVDPSYMRRGIGSALVSAISERVRALGFESLEVVANPHALAFYERVGFATVQPTGTEGSSTLRMRKLLRRD